MHSHGISKSAKTCQQCSAISKSAEEPALRSQSRQKRVSNALHVSAAYCDTTNIAVTIMIMHDSRRCRDACSRWYTKVAQGRALGERVCIPTPHEPRLPACRDERRRASTHRRSSATVVSHEPCANRLPQIQGVAPGIQEPCANRRPCAILRHEGVWLDAPSA